MAHGEVPTDRHGSASAKAVFGSKLKLSSGLDVVGKSALGPLALPWHSPGTDVLLDRFGSSKIKENHGPPFFKPRLTAKLNPTFAQISGHNPDWHLVSGYWLLLRASCFEQMRDRCPPGRPCVSDAASGIEESMHFSLTADA
jgi:hypothetical protein